MVDMGATTRSVDVQPLQREAIYEVDGVREDALEVVL